MRKPFISIIVPVYNEEKRIYNLVEIFDFFKKRKYNSEVVVVNDGSIDRTLLETKKILQSKKGKKTDAHLISYSKNQGKGHAVKKGMLGSYGNFRLFMDIDLSTPLGNFDKFEKHFDKHEVLIGSRKTLGARVSQKQPRLRELLGKSFTLLSRQFLQVYVSDFTCGFKCFSESAAKNVFSRQKIHRWGFDSEILFIATKLGYKIKEVPVSWKNHPSTKVKFPQDIISSAVELGKIRGYYHRGHYFIHSNEKKSS